MKQYEATPEGKLAFALWVVEEPLSNIQPYLVEMVEGLYRMELKTLVIFAAYMGFDVSKAKSQEDVRRIVLETVGLA